MNIIVGLGNPGNQYASTPHNVGFEAVDLIAKAIGVEWEMKRAFNAMIAKGSFGGKSVLLVKPQTFMNLSGEAVAPIVKYNNATVMDVVVIQDDIDMAIGMLRIRKGGSAGGHNGLKSLIAHLGTQDFVRVKIGVGKDRSDVVGHVLGKFDSATRNDINLVIEEAAKAVESILREGVAAAMNHHNGMVLERDDAK